jgi:hypothetical protein
VSVFLLSEPVKASDREDMEDAKCCGCWYATKPYLKKALKILPKALRTGTNIAEEKDWEHTDKLDTVTTVTEELVPHAEDILNPGGS